MKSERTFPIALLLVVLVLIVFGQSIYFDFVGFDDPLHVLDNPYFHPISFEHLMQLWREPYKSVFMPVTYMLLAAVAKVGELPVADEQGVRFNPYLFHAVDVLLHLTNVLLVWGILRRIVRSTWAAALGAAVFAVHPLQVESVAWISSTKDLLGGLFSLAAIWFYLRYSEQTRSLRWIDYAAAVIAFGLALLSKATAVVTPMIILILIVLLRRAKGKSALGIVPLFLVSLPFLWLTRHHQQDASILVWSPMWARSLIAVDAISFYLWKLIWPMRLTIDYARSPQWVMGHPQAWAIWILPVGLATWLWWQRRRVPQVVAGAAIFVVALTPVLGFVPFEFQGYSTVADRYVYLPAIGVALAVAGLATIAYRRGQIAAVGIVLVLALLSGRETSFWKNSSTLFNHAVAAVPDSAFGWQGIGTVRQRNGDFAGAAEAYRHAIAVRPDDIQALNGLSDSLMRIAPNRDAALAYAAFAREAARRVLLKYPQSAFGHRKMGTALGIQGHPDDAAKEFELAIHADPTDAQTYVEYGEMLEMAGNNEKAVEQYEAALRLHPDDVRISDSLQRSKRKINHATTHDASAVQH